jgi:hypothetical protein
MIPFFIANRFSYVADAPGHRQGFVRPNLERGDRPLSYFGKFPPSVLHAPRMDNS